MSQRKNIDFFLCNNFLVAPFVLKKKTLSLQKKLTRLFVTDENVPWVKFSELYT